MTMPGAAAVSAALSGLVDTCRDGELGFHAAAAGMEDPTLRQLCVSYADQRAAFRDELLEELAGLGGSAGSEAAERVAGGRDAVAAAEEAGTVTLSDLARRDAEAEAAYRDALGRGLPGHATSTVGRQYEQVVDARKHLSLLERSLVAVA